jgi:branched-chain amino acid aminotransferase/4-amino-4-deoxychorismate lyase
VIPDDDRGLLLGDGLYETVLAEAGELRHWDAHLARMIRGAGTLGIAAPDPDAALQAARRALEDSGLAGVRAAVRVTLTAGSGRGLERPAGSSPRLIVTASSSPEPSGPVILRTVEIRRNDTSPAARLKTLSYLDNILARRQARAQGADAALMLNTRGELASADAANLFWITGAQLRTPALECGILDGVLRASVLEEARRMGLDIQEVRAGPQDLAAADAAFLTSSLVGVRGVSQIDGRAFEPHPLTEALSSRCR